MAYHVAGLGSDAKKATLVAAKAAAAAQTAAQQKMSEMKEQMRQKAAVKTAAKILENQDRVANPGVEFLGMRFTTKHLLYAGGTIVGVGLLAAIVKKG